MRGQSASLIRNAQGARRNRCAIINRRPVQIPVIKDIAGCLRLSLDFILVIFIIVGPGIIFGIFFVLAIFIQSAYLAHRIVIGSDIEPILLKLSGFVDYNGIKISAPSGGKPAVFDKQLGVIVSFKFEPVFAGHNRDIDTT